MSLASKLSLTILLRLKFSDFPSPPLYLLFFPILSPNLSSSQLRILSISANTASFPSDFFSFFSHCEYRNLKTKGYYLTINENNETSFIQVLYKRKHSWSHYQPFFMVRQCLTQWCNFSPEFHDDCVENIKKECHPRPEDEAKHGIAKTHSRLLGSLSLRHLLYPLLYIAPQKLRLRATHYDYVVDKFGQIIYDCGFCLFLERLGHGWEWIEVCSDHSLRYTYGIVVFASCIDHEELRALVEIQDKHEYVKTDARLVWGQASLGKMHKSKGLWVSDARLARLRMTDEMNFLTRPPGNSLPPPSYRAFLP